LEAKRPRGSTTHGIKAEIKHITGMVYVQKINYPSTNIHHKYNTGTILGTRPHTNTNKSNTYTIPEITQIKYNHPSKGEIQKEVRTLA